MAGLERIDRRALYQRASGRQGIFTIQDAVACGFSEPVVHHLARTGRFEHLGRGVYRLTDYRDRMPSGLQSFPHSSRRR